MRGTAPQLAALVAILAAGCTDFREGLRCLSDADCRGLTCFNGFCGDKPEGDDLQDPGEVTVFWDFEGKSCAETPAVASVQFDVDTTLALPARRQSHGCRNDDEDGAVLGNFEPGEHAFAARALSADGAVLFVAQGSFTVAGDVDVYVRFTGPARLTLERTWFDGSAAANEFYRGVQTPVGIELRNQGSAPAVDVTGTLRADYAGVTVADGGRVALGTLDAGGTACVRADASGTGGDCETVLFFPHVVADGTVPDNASVEFTLTLTSSTGSSWTLPFNGFMRGNPPH